MLWLINIAALLAISLWPSAYAIKYDAEFVGYNLNENETATVATDYWGEWADHNFTSSPSNWRFPFYALTLDRYVNGDPTNDEANGTVFEHDWMTNQFRFGGDLAGLSDDLDYIQGMGIKALYLTGSPFINMPWAGDGYGPLDFTLLDMHHGMIEDWRNLINAIHERDMYVILDNTMATMGDLIGFNGYLNASTPFNWNEYDYVWKEDRRYHDFQPGDAHLDNDTCIYPRIWSEEGYPLGTDITDNYNGCRDSEFDQYGDMKGIGSFPSWQTQLSKFASVQDRLREWHQPVLEKIKRMSCIQIAMLDIDGFRMDKGLQTTIDAMAEFTSHMRECAREYNKENFFIVGEIVGEVPFTALYMGRGMEPENEFTNITEAMMASNISNTTTYVREFGNSALDAGAFHYSTYGGMTRFLGLDGDIGGNGVDFAGFWEAILNTDDMVNANTGLFDPRHMFGMTNQDVFRWPALTNGTQRQALGAFITTLGMVGIPLMLFGEEQAYYILESTAADYVFGRGPMASARAWQIHGCNTVGEEVYVNMPFNSSKYGCYDDNVSLDHRDPSKDMRLVYKRMFELRRQYPVLNDGWIFENLSNKTRNIYLPGSVGMPSPTGLWSLYRGRQEYLQDLSGEGQGNQGVWLVHHNEDATVDYSFDCSNSSDALISPFSSGTTVKNLFYPYEEYTLEASTQSRNIEGATGYNGCLPNMTMVPWEFKAYVPIANWSSPAPVITSVSPSHDQRLVSTVSADETEDITIEIHFSELMDCDSVTNNFNITSTTVGSVAPTVNTSSIYCKTIDSDTPSLVGSAAGAWTYRVQLLNVANGVHQFSINNATNQAKNQSTGALDKFRFRIGQTDNPLIFPVSGNYSTSLYHQDSSSGELYISPNAAGADKLRYSTNWGSSWSSWQNYTGANVTVVEQSWNGTKTQEWSGDHVVVQYWSKLTGSAEHMQHGDIGRDNLPARRWPHVFVEGSWNQYGYDNGLPSQMKQNSEGLWEFDLVGEWPIKTKLNVWGMNPDGMPDKSKSFGDVDNDGVLDWLPPDTLLNNVINITAYPSMPHLGYKILANDGNYNYKLVPVGSVWYQFIVAILISMVPIIFACAAVWAFMGSFYKVKFNEIGISEKTGLSMSAFKATVSNLKLNNASSIWGKESRSELAIGAGALTSGPVAADAGAHRRTVLIATMEYEIEDWAIKIKIGGLGVMSSLMGKNLGHQNLIWVVPCVGDVEYPVDQVGEVMKITILGKEYEIEVQYHVVRNITYVLLDAPVFRRQSKAEPYPARMDDLDSAVYYSAWNACIAKAIERFPVDLYHINDYHGAVAPLHLLPKTIPVCLSLHNAEFQGLWPLRTPQEMKEICGVYNLSEEVIKKYVQFGEVFNLLHAGASYLRVHQKGFGAVGVSKKYGKRSWARYPIFWGLSKIGSLPNPDPSDTAEWDKKLPDQDKITIDATAEAERGNLRVQAQQWAGLEVDPTAELFVFVGRWSMQKGVDLIADVFFSLLEENPKVQLITVGPVIDLYGKFAALKLSKLMAKYPTRVFSKPEFTALPPYLFSGAEFALIPSRDEPFGLVAVEFGRKGALGVGARVGGLGQMPGWWFTLESTSTKHLMGQFKSAIRSALSSKTEVRAMMRARSALQRFPVAQWVEDLEILQSTSIDIHHKRATKAQSLFNHSNTSGVSTVLTYTPGMSSMPISRAPSPEAEEAPHYFSSINTTMGSNVGPGAASMSSPTTPQISRSATLISGQFSRRGSSDYGDSVYADSVVDNEYQHGFAPSGRFDYSLAGAPAFGAQAPNPAFLNTDPYPSPNGSTPSTPVQTDGLMGGQHPLNTLNYKSKSQLSLAIVIGDKQDDFDLQKVDPFFTDADGAYYSRFEKMLDEVTGKTSENQFCIETYLVKSEKKWFNQRHNAKLGRSAPNTPITPLFRRTSDNGGTGSVQENYDGGDFGLGNDYKVPTGLKKFLAYKIGDWQLYTLLLAFGQIIAANSYQITLIAGQNGQSAEQVYVIACIYLVGSAGWWLMFRRLKSVYVLSTPFIFYGLAFFLLGMVPYFHTSSGKAWTQNVATAMYAIASSSGSLFFALNFGDEGGAPIESWAFRACVIQGTQQVYVAFLWYWGAKITAHTNSGSTTTLLTSTKIVTAITTPIAVLLWGIGFILFIGLPKYYRQNPGAVPSFYSALLRRKIVLWFLVMVVLQNYWLSPTYGRSWHYLWSSQHAPVWAIVLLILFFFIGVWSGVLWTLASLTKHHSWVIPIFAIGLGAPRWCQQLWGVSNIGLYIPWGTPAEGAVLGRALWCWLGVLDAVQGVGFGMILLQTLTRVHIAASLIAAQIIGSAITILARATAPNKVGPGSVFPDFALGWSGLAHPWFWVALGCQGIICVGFFTFFRKEQLSKP